MGFNTTVVVLNDALSSIENDPQFGAKLASAIRQAACRSECPVDVTAGNHCNAASVVESHHADTEVLVKVARNEGVVVPCPAPARRTNRTRADLAIANQRLVTENTRLRETLRWYATELDARRPVDSERAREALTHTVNGPAIPTSDFSRIEELETALQQMEADLTSAVGLDGAAEAAERAARKIRRLIFDPVWDCPQCGSKDATCGHMDDVQP